MTTRHALLRQLADLELAKIGADGKWTLTSGGQDFLDQLDLLRELDHRTPAARPSSPLGGRLRPDGDGARGAPGTAAAADRVSGRPPRRGTRAKD